MEPISLWYEMPESSGACPRDVAIWRAIEHETACCFAALLMHLTTDEFTAFARTPFCLLPMYYETLGAWLRDNLLAPDCVLNQLLREAGYTLPHDMSPYVLRAFHKFTQVMSAFSQ